MNIKRGDVLLVALDPTKGSEQGKTRPCVVVQNDVGNKYGSTTIVAPITSTIPDKQYPTSVIIQPSESGLKHESTILCSQLRTVSVQHRVLKKIGELTEPALKKVDEALKTSLALEQ